MNTEPLFWASVRPLQSEDYNYRLCNERRGNASNDNDLLMQEHKKKHGSHIQIVNFPLRRRERHGEYTQVVPVLKNAAQNKTKHKKQTKNIVY